MKPISVYDGHTRKRLAYLQNAYNISYEKSINALWTAKFSLPYSDPKNSYCEAFNLVEIWEVDGNNSDKYVGLFRIMPKTESIIGTEASSEYTLEHVLSTLLDDTLIGWHEIGNLGVYTSQVIAYILDGQLDKRWVLDTCDYSHQYLYGWQDENLLSALYSVVKPFEETDYYWDFDTKKFPWSLRLLKTKSDPVTDIRYRKNVMGITRTVDPSNLTTRLYCYGYGEGDNKLSIANLNNGKPYLDSENIAKYGIITQIWTDERYTIEESLLATGQAMLKKLENPEVTYELDISTINNAANLNMGDMVRVVSEDFDQYMIVQKISKDNLSGAPKDGKITLGEGTTDLSDSLASMSEKQRISETYSQGAESIFIDSFYDNADYENPSIVTFIIPSNAVHVNEILFSAKLSSFRAYSKAIEGGGSIAESTSAGGGTNVSSSSGGATYTSSGSGGESVQASSAGGNTYTSSGSGGGGVTSAESGGSSYTSSGSAGEQSVTSTYNDQTSIGDAIWTESWSATSHTSVPQNTGGVSTAHYHVLHTHTHNNTHRHIVTIPAHTHTITIGSHTHTVQIPSHEHTISISSHVHTVSIPSHTHSVSISAHTHDVSIPNHVHNITLPNHTHGIEYGIYKGPTASEMAVLLDDTFIGAYSSSVSGINLISYMSKNANGEIMRGTHTITIIPSSLTRIEGSFQIRLFTNAHGGAQY